MHPSRPTATRPALLIRAALLVVLALGLGGCATQADAPAAPMEAGALLGLSPDGAFYRDGQLVLQYRIGQDTAFRAASWPVDDLRPDQHNYRVAMMDLSTEAPASPAELQRD
ncbi:MAG: hypothetical protein EHM68_17510 [Lysobacterales bacterium]|nr:MAG: hypothetical protein EHM68_17510 [Xanthomonadales bacterium]